MLTAGRYGGARELNELFAWSLSERLNASRKYEVFGLPVTFTGTEKASWLQLRGGSLTGGEPWPDVLKDSVKHWPEHAFGTANAAVLVLWHRPGMGAGGSEPGGYLGPQFPNLGGIPHLHVREWPRRHPDPSWNNLTKFVAAGLRAIDITDPWPHVMCLNPEPGQPVK